MKKVLFKGAATALVTPFKNDSSPDIDKLEELIEFQIQSGIQAIVIAGTTGEASTLTFEEFSLLVAKSAQFIRHRVPLIAGTGSNDTAKALKLSLEAEKRGADGLLIVTPYYNKTTQEGLIRHYYTIADRTDLPILLYNVPGRTGLKIEPETCQKLFEHPNIIGLKDAGNNISATADFIARRNEEQIYSGNDDQIVPILSLGGAGVISVLSNVAPYEVQNICRAYFEGNTKKAADEQLRLLPLIRALFSRVNPIPIKAAMKLIGRDAGDPRLPLVPCDEETLQRLKAEIARADLVCQTKKETPRRPWGSGAGGGT